MDVFSKSKNEYGAFSLPRVPVANSEVITTAYAAMKTVPFNGSANFGLPIGESLRTKLATVVNGTTRCIMNPGYELRSGLSGNIGKRPIITTAKITASVVADDSLRKYNHLCVTSVSFLASIMQTIPNMNETIDVKKVPQNVMYRSLSKIGLLNMNLEYSTAVVPHRAIKKHRSAFTFFFSI
jgi:hypothetical protein